jgi:hypothetical protein
MTSLFQTPRLFLFALFVCFLTLPAPAQVPGADDPSYAESVAAWLTGDDDLAALQSLGALAADGNTAAQILLARLERTAHLTAHLTDGMARADRIALLRQPGGLSGRSWMDAAAETSPLAQAFLDNATQDTRVESLRLLFESGEHAYATRSLPGLLSHDPDEWARAMQDMDVMPDEARVLIASVASMEMFFRSGMRIDIANPVQERRPPEIALIWNPVDPFEARLNPEARALAMTHAVSIPSHAPMRTLCEARCGDELNACMAAGAALLGISAAPIMPFASPSEALIPNEAYWSSPRMEADVLRLLRTQMDPALTESLSELNACFVQMIGD